MSNTNSSVTATFNLVPNPLPTTTSIAPTSRVAGDGAFTLTVNGTNFVASSVVRWAGADRVTTFVSSTQLTAAIPATDLTTTGPKAITVFNAAPGGGTSNAQTFTVNANPVPTTTSISPNTTDVGSGAFTLTVDGTNFVGNSVVRVNGAARTTIFVSSTELTAVIPASDTATTGAKTITVFNAAPVGGASNPQTLAVIPCSTIICIDGNIADWTAIPATPSYADNTTDAGGGSGDITAIRITSGNGNLYVRWDETLTSNKNMIASDGFSITVDANRDGTSDARGWVTFDSSGVPTVQVERPFGTFVTVGSAQQSCNFSACSNGGAASLEASFPLSAFAATASIIGLQTETRASASTNSSTKDCVPGPIACNGFFNLDTDTGTTTVTAGHVTTTTLNCPDPVRNLSQATGTCTVTVHDTGVDTNSVVVPVAHPTGTVNFSVSNGTGTFTPIACTLSAAAAAADSTCTVTYTPTTGTANHTLKATYAGDTAPIQFASSSGTDSLAINSAPTDISLTPSSVAENQPSGTTVGTLSTTDPNAGNTFTYSLVGGTGSTDNASFTISGTQVLTAASFDFEAKSSYSIRVRTTDQGGLTFEKALTITVTNVNEAPVITSNGGGTTASISVPENTTTVTTVTATDPDAGSTLTYSISGGADAATFAINPTTGVLTFIAAPNFESKTDANNDGVYEVTVSVSDGSLADTQAISVTVTNVNEAPVAVNDSYSATEGILLTVGAPGVLGNDTDVDGGTTLTAVQVTGPTHAASFTLNANGSFNYTATSGFVGTDSFTYRANDGALNSNTATVTITVASGNTAPTCATPQSGSTNEDTTLNGSVVCTDAQANTLSYSVVTQPTHGTLTLNADGSFTYTPAANYNGPDSFTYKANDGSLDSNVATVNDHRHAGQRRPGRRRTTPTRPTRTRR